jgi:hypothetical protein
MGRYPDSSTTLRPTPDGTKWDSGSPFDYSDDIERRSRVPPNAERKEFEEAQARDAGKLLRSFVSQCATAYADHKLSADYPIAPKPLSRIINAAGGNVSWLASDHDYRAFFVKAYCRLAANRYRTRKSGTSAVAGRPWRPPRLHGGVVFCPTFRTGMVLKMLKLLADRSGQLGHPGTHARTSTTVYAGLMH